MLFARLCREAHALRPVFDDDASIRRHTFATPTLFADNQATSIPSRPNSRVAVLKGAAVETGKRCRLINVSTDWVQRAEG
jgi:hypothetical protein